MTDSQAIFWMTMAAVCGWAPLFLLVAALTRRNGAPSVAAELLQGVREGFSTMLRRWPSLANGQKWFLLAASFSSGAAVIAVARTGAEFAAWVCVTFGGLSVEEASVPEPLGSWLLVWGLQAGLIAAFYAWLQFGNKPSRI